MLQKGIQKRKTRNLLHRLAVSLSIFTLTLLVCLGGYFLFFVKKSSVVSPLTSGIIQKSITPSKSVEINQIKNFCNSQKISCSRIYQEGRSITISLASGQHIFLSSDKDIVRQLSSLQLTLNQLTIEGKQFKVLDFRFDKITISF